MTLTPAGVAFLPDARRILQLAEGAALTVKRVPAGDLGTVVVGFTAASAHAVLPRLLDKAREQLPDVQLELREMVTAAQIEGLMTGELDLGMARPPLKRPGLVSRPLLHEQLVAAVPSAHPLAALPRQLTLTDLDGQDVIMYSPVRGAVLQRAADQHVHHRGGHPPLCPVRHAGAHHAGAGAFRASASPWCPRRRPPCIPTTWCFGRSAHSGSGRSNSTPYGGATAPTRRCCGVLRDVLPAREWTTDDLVEEVVV